MEMPFKATQANVLHAVIKVGSFLRAAAGIYWVPSTGTRHAHDNVLDGKGTKCVRVSKGEIETGAGERKMRCSACVLADAIPVSKQLACVSIGRGFLASHWPCEALPSKGVS